MKLNAREAARACAQPDPQLSGLLIYGEDETEVSERRKRAVSALLGDDPDRDLRLTQLAAADVRRDGAALSDALRSVGFFGGRPIVVVEGAGDGVTGAVEGAFSDITPEDGFLIVTAGILPARSKLRKLFEASRIAAAAPCYADAISREEVRSALESAGISAIDTEAVEAIEAIAGGLDRAAFRDFVERLTLYQIGSDAPVSAADVEAVAPAGRDADIDGALDAIADGRTGEIGAVLSRLQAQGVQATTIVIAAQRKFRQLHKVAAAGGGAEQAVIALRPPVFGPRRAAMIRQVRTWPMARLERALCDLLEADSQLRGGADVVGFAVLERAFIRISLLAGR